MPFWPIANTPISSVEEAATQGVAMNNQHRATHQQPPSDWLKPAVQGETCRGDDVSRTVAEKLLHSRLQLMAQLPEQSFMQLAFVALVLP